MKFFKTSTHNLLTHGAAAGVGHHVALSVVGSGRFLKNAYFRAKLAQEKLIKESSIPYSIIQPTQFFEFVANIADAATHGNVVRVSPALIQPIAADDVASAVASIAGGPPLNGTVEVAGPESVHLDALIRRSLSARNDPREVITDPHALYFGAELSERTLVAGDDARLGAILFEEWLRRSIAETPQTNPQRVDNAGAPIQPAAFKENEFRISEVPPGSALLVGDRQEASLWPRAVSRKPLADAEQTDYPLFGCGPWPGSQRHQFPSTARRRSPMARFRWFRFCFATIPKPTARRRS